jgi:NTE family protein
MPLGCRGFIPVNTPIDQVRPGEGYRVDMARQQHATGKVWLFLAFSGGGTRAAAFSYGVLEGLRDTRVVVDGEPIRLLDEVDVISGVSGGSFPAAFYGLFGDEIFEEFEPRFLKKNIQRSLFLKALNPINLFKLMTPYLSRSDLAAKYYHENIFEQATFADLVETPGPLIHINATDLLHGTSFRFNQDAFDAICSDLDPFPVSSAVAASSAVPVLLSPITLRNHAGSCGYQAPEWFAEALESRETNPRGYQAAKNASVLLHPDKRYIHLIDGGVSDNLGLRMPLDRVAAIGNAEKARELGGIERPDHLVFLVVNAETEPDPAIDLTAAAPSIAASMNLVSGSQIRRYNFETLMLARESVEDFGRDLSTVLSPVTAHFVEVSFDLIKGDQRSYFKRMPTSFVLSDQQVDDLRTAGRRLLADSVEFNEFLEVLAD